MMLSNLIIIWGMTIQGKGLAAGVSKGMSVQEAHDDMVESFGLTWLLSGTALGHIGECSPRIHSIKSVIEGAPVSLLAPFPRQIATYCMCSLDLFAVGAGAILGCTSGGFF